MRNLLLTLIISTSWLLPTPALAQTFLKPSTSEPIYARIERSEATRAAIQLHLQPGRIASINWQTGERITYVDLGDHSKIVYTTNTDLASGQASSIFLKLIEPLEFPGATQTNTPNLIVQTIDRQGRQRLYSFDLIANDKPDYQGIQIVGTLASTQTLQLFNNRRVNLDQIEQGLLIAINQGYISSDDPLAFRVKQVLAAARNNNISLLELTQQFEVPLAVLTELGQLYLDRFFLNPDPEEKFAEEIP